MQCRSDVADLSLARLLARAKTKPRRSGVLWVRCVTTYLVIGPCAANTIARACLTLSELAKRCLKYTLAALAEALKDFSSDALSIRAVDEVTGFGLSETFKPEAELFAPPIFEFFAMDFSQPCQCDG